MEPSFTVGRSARRALRVVFVFLAALLAAEVASADVITGPPPEDDCPEGSTGMNCLGYGHGSDTCRPQTCTRDEDCGDEGICQNADLCIARVECGIEDPDAGPTYQDDVVGSCEEGSACDEGTCQTLQVCATAPVFESAGGCDCASGGGGGSGAFPVLVFFGGVAFLGRILRRRSRG